MGLIRLKVRRFPSLPVPNYSLFISRHFGTGVLIATAFVHLFPTAYISLTDPCLPPFWTEGYPAMPGFISMTSVLMVVGIEMVFAIKGAGHSHSVDLDNLRGDERQEQYNDGGLRPDNRRSGSFKPFRQEALEPRRHSEDEPTLPLQRSPYSDNPGSLDKPLPSPPRQEGDESDGSDLDLDELEDGDDQAGLLDSAARKVPATPNGHVNGRPGPPSRNVSFADPQTSVISSSQSAPKAMNEQRLILQCLLLEAGILFHSVFIGMALSVSTGPPFVVLLIAISFHQTFEGLALGSRIAAIPSFSTTSLKPWAMSFMYGVTTPIGQAIGLAVHTLYDPASQFGLLMVGIVNAISSGLLIYAGLVQLLAEDFLSDQSYVDLRGRKRMQACGAVIGGSLLMGKSKRYVHMVILTTICSNRWSLGIDTLCDIKISFIAAVKSSSPNAALPPLYAKTGHIRSRRGCDSCTVRHTERTLLRDTHAMHTTICLVLHG